VRQRTEGARGKGDDDFTPFINYRKRTMKNTAKFLRTGLLVSVLGASFAMNVVHAAPADDTEVKKSEKVVSDSWITTKVKSELLANSVTKAVKVSVKTKQGTVWLTGKLPSQDAIDVAKMTAEKVQGVKSVDTSGLTVAAN
jgi:osmotically-inducible protein OsmY